MVIALAWANLFALGTGSWAQVTVSIDTSAVGQRQVIDGFGTCLCGTEPGQAWWQQLYYDDLGASILRMALTPVFRSPYSDHLYNSPTYGGDPPFPGPDNNNVRTYTNALDYMRLYAGRRAQIAIMGPNIDTNIGYFDFEADWPRIAGLAAQAGLSRVASLGDFKLVGSLWSPAPWVKVPSGNAISGTSGWYPVSGTRWPFIWTHNFAGGKLDISGKPLAQFDDSALGGTGPTSALTQFTRGTAAYLRGFQNRFGVRFYAVSLQNELGFETHYDSCIYPLSSQYITALKALRTELDRYPDLADIRIFGPEDAIGSDAYGLWQYGSGASTYHKNLQYLRNIAADPVAASAEAFFCIHGYQRPLTAMAVSWSQWFNGWVASPAPGIPANVHGFSYYNKKSWMTESSEDDPAWLSPASGLPVAGAWSIALSLHQALVIGWQSAWVYWLFTDGTPVSQYTLTDATKLGSSPKYAAAKHFFRYIRPNAVRVTAAVNGSADLNASAYYHAGNQTLTIVLVNSSINPITAVLALPPTPAGILTFQVFTSSDDHYWQSSTVNVNDSHAFVSVPGYGVVTLYGAGGAVAPSISSQPRSQTVNACSTVTFSVEAAGTSPLNYQWMKEGVPLGGATASSLTLNNVQTSQAGNYSVVVNGFGTATSHVATLAVGPATNIPWEQGQVIDGFQDDFNASTRNPNWTVCGAGGDHYMQADGVLTVTVQDGDPNHLLYNASYDRKIQEVVARIRMPTVWSGNEARAGIGTVVTPSSSQGIDLLFRNTTQNGITGGQLELLDDLVAWGPVGLPFPWKANTWYWMRLRHEPDANGKTSDVFAKVWPSDGVTPEPGPWQLSWAYSPPLPLDTGLAGITATSVSAAGQGAFQIDYILIKASQLPSITVDMGMAPPTISVQPQSQIVTSGTSVSFSVTTAGNGPLSYQWRFNGMNLTDGGRISGSQSESLTVAGVQASDAGSYQIVVANSSGSVTSQVASLTVVSAQPEITWATPAPLTYGAALDSSQLNATASVPGSFAYSPADGAVLDAGTNTLSAAFTPSDTTNFTTVSASVSVVVLPAPLNVTAANATRAFAAANPAWTGSLAGVVNGDDITATFSCSATPASPPGTYPIVPGLVDPNHRLANYLVSLINGTLTILPPVLVPPVFQAVTVTDGRILLTWSTVSGQTYQMQYKTDLSQAVWNNLGTTVVATASLQTVSDTPDPDAQRFYRVVLMP